MPSATLPGHTPGTGGQTYRPEIDGLRAVAIASVVVHHADPGLLPGGFTGVDVFFVISGYLITGIIAGELAEGRFSLLRFYARRARRIVPALAVMLLATTAAAWAILTPLDFGQFAKALAASALFASNLHFARGTDYFDSAAGAEPLIHTWTLGVEEQFYLLFPLLLIAVSRFWPRALFPLVAVLGVASFALTVWLAPRAPQAAFYLLPTRMWELMLGAACALLPLRPRANGMLGAAGLALILAGFWVIGPDSLAPGPLFLLPAGGTALAILFAGEGTAVQRALAWRPLAALGLISFGTYLWHQPLLAFAQYIWFGPLPLAIVLAAVAASLALGALSFRLIEQPVRQRRWLAQPRTLALACTAGLALPLTAGAAAYLGAFTPHSMAEATRLGGLQPPDAKQRAFEPAEGPLAFVLYGDSHAGQYHAAAAARFGPGALLSQPGCLSLGALSNHNPDNPGGEQCLALAGRLTDLVERRRVTTVIWAQRWERLLYTRQSPSPLGMTNAEGWPHLRRAMAQMADALPAKTRIILIGNSPTA